MGILYNNVRNATQEVITCQSKNSQSDRMVDIDVNTKISIFTGPRSEMRRAKEMNISG